MGKERKVRVVPLMDATARILRAHLRENDLDRPERKHQPLFQNRQSGRLSRSGIRYLLQSHVQAIRSDLSGFTQPVSPHSLRHTKGMHLLQSGISLEIIRDFLGHVDGLAALVVTPVRPPLLRRVASAPVQEVMLSPGQQSQLLAGDRAP